MRAFQPRPVSPIQRPKIYREPQEMPVAPAESEAPEEKNAVKKPQLAVAVLAARVARPHIVRPVVHSPEEVRQMDDYELCREFIRATGLTTLSCKHCGRDVNDREKGVQRHIYPHFMNAIRRRAEKEGLSRDMKLPKTCDSMMKRNDVCNPVNNPAYYIIHHASSDSSEIADAIEKRQEGLQAIGIATRPHRYD